MKRKSISVFSLTILTVLFFAPLGKAQDKDRFQGQHEHQGPPVDVNEVMAQSAAGAAIPLWQEPFKAFNGTKGDYMVTIVGRHPKLPNPPPKGVTSVPVELVPVVIYFVNWNLSVSWLSDPTASVTEACADEQVKHKVPVDLTAASPLFNDASMKWSDKLDMGTTQFMDAQMRAEFWGWMPAIDSWHTKLRVHVHEPVTLYVPPGLWSLDPNICGGLGKINDQYLDTFLRLQTLQLPAGSIALFVTKNGIETDIRNNDFLGYHDAWTPLFGTTRVYGIGPFYISHEIWPDIKTLTHEIGEIMNDPLPSSDEWNNTPDWRKGPDEGCQNNFEVGDPRNPRQLGLHEIELGGFKYHPQELALFGWFYRMDNVALNGQYSTLGTFSTNAGDICN